MFGWLRKRREDNAIRTQQALFREEQSAKMRTLRDRIARHTPPQAPEPYFKLAMLLSANDPDVDRYWQLYLGDDRALFEQWVIEQVGEDSFYEWVDGEQSHFTALQHSLETFGYIGANDWKFSLKDLLYNQRKAFEKFGVDPAVYDVIPKQSCLLAPFAIELVERYLPPGFDLALWDTGGDDIFIVIGPRQMIDKAVAMAEQLGHGIFTDYYLLFSGNQINCPRCNRWYPYQPQPVPCPHCGQDRFDFATWPDKPHP